MGLVGFIYRAKECYSKTVKDCIVDENYMITALVGNVLLSGNLIAHAPLITCMRSRLKKKKQLWHLKLNNVGIKSIARAIAGASLNESQRDNAHII